MVVITVQSSRWHINSAARLSSDYLLNASGNRNSASGAFNNVGSNGYNWSGSVTGSNGYNLYFNSTQVYPANTANRAAGLPVRCIQEYTAALL